MKSPSQRKKNIIVTGLTNPLYFFIMPIFWHLAGRNNFFYDIDAASPECKNYFLQIYELRGCMIF